MQKEIINGKAWDRIIESDSKKRNSGLKQVWDYKDLVFLFVKRDFIVYYKQTILGPLWYLIQPILSTIMYTIIFGNLANLGTDSIPNVLFYYFGTMLWTYFSGTLLEISNVFFANKAMFSKVYFPRLVVPISTVISLLIKLLIQIMLFIVLCIIYFARGFVLDFSLKILLFPVVIIWIGFLGCGFGMIISSLTTKYRDIALALNFLVSLFMYATPVVYPISEVPSKWIYAFELNPICAPFEIGRYLIFGYSQIDSWSVLLSLFCTAMIFAIGLKIFNKIERTFVDVI